MKIYYVNLDRDEERRERLEGQLAELGLAATRIRATTPADITPDLIARHCDAEKLDYVTPGELACTLSHSRTWQTMLDDGEPHALVLEDDILLSPGLPAFLDRAAPLMARFGLVHVEAHARRLRIGRRLATVGKIGLHRPHSFNYGTGGYILTARVAHRLLGGLCNFDHCVDNILFDPACASSRRLRPVQTVPALVANGGVAADLQGQINQSHLRDARLERVAQRTARYQAMYDRSVWAAWPLRPVRTAWEQFAGTARDQFATHIFGVTGVRMKVAGMQLPKKIHRPDP